MLGSASGSEEPNDDDLRRIYAETKTIAVVGMSGDPGKAAHAIPRYLQAQGYRILPVSPRGGEILGEPVAASLEEVSEGVDVVDVFRPPAEAGDVARSVARSGAKVLWFQPGTGTEEAVAMAREAGLTVVSGRCMGETHARLGLGPGPYA
jgi:predicted CoA-binding protein